MRKSPGDTLNGWTVWGLHLINLFKEETNINSMPSSQGTYNRTVERKNSCTYKTGVGDFKK